MAYLKLVFDELEIAHLSEDGQYLCANKGVPQYRTDYLTSSAPIRKVS